MAAVNNNEAKEGQDLPMAMEEQDENVGPDADVDQLANQVFSHMMGNKCPSIVSAF